MKKTLLALLLIAIVSIPALRALAIPDFYTSHDGLTHTARLANYYLALKEGQIPARLAPKLFGGLGYPIFIYIYPLPYFLGSLFHTLGFSFTDAFELVIGASFLFSALTMFLFARELFGVRLGLLAAVFYSWAPYRFSQIYVRAAIAESFAYIFIPIVLLALLKLSRSPTWRWVGIGSFAVSGLLLSHQLVSLMFLPVFALLGLVFLKGVKEKKTYLLASGFTAIIGFIASAFIYLPTLFERVNLRFEELINYYADHFVTIPQLIHSPWSYGFSMPGTINDDMSFQVGLTHLLVAGLSTLLLLFLFVKYKKAATKTPHFWIGFTSLVIFAVSILLMLEHPVIHWIWKTIPGIAVVDFPWRFLGVSVFASSLLVAYLVKTINNKLLFLLLLFLVFYSNRNHLRINKTQIYKDEFFLAYSETATWRNEFLPIWRKTNKLQNIEENFKVAEGKLIIEPQKMKTDLLTFRVEAPEEGALALHRLYFPGWKVFLNGKELVLGEGLEISQEIQLETETSPYVDRSGFLKVTIPPGSHRLKAKFSETPLRKFGFVLSLTGFILIIWTTFIKEGKIDHFRSKKRKKRKRK